MSTLTKISSGEIYINDFSTMSSLWQISPNVPERFILTGNGLVMTHGDVRIMYLMRLPDDDCIFQAKIIYMPTLIIDNGGIIVMADVNNCVECTVYYNSLLDFDQYYEYIKVTKIGSTFSFDISKDGLSWNRLGSSKIMDAHDIGFFLDGVDNENCVSLTLENVLICKSNYISIKNISIGMKVRIVSSTNEIISYYINDGASTDVSIDISTYSFPIKDAVIEVYDSSDIMVLSQVTDIVGGDVFEYNVLLEVYVDGTVIDPTSFIDIGGIPILGKEYEIEIKNIDTQIITGKKISIVEYSPFFKGYSFTKVSLNTEVLDFQQSINLPSIEPNSSCLCVLRVDRDLTNTGPFFAQQYRFKIVIG